MGKGEVRGETSAGLTLSLHVLVGMFSLVDFFLEGVSLVAVLPGPRSSVWSSHWTPN